MSASTCVACGASSVIIDHDGRCAGCALPVSRELSDAVGRLVERGKVIDEQRARLKAMRDAETDPVQREAYAMAARAGFDWYDTESSARRAFEHAAGELLAERLVLTAAEMDAIAGGRAALRTLAGEVSAVVSSEMSRDEQHLGTLRSKLTTIYARQLAREFN